MTNWPEQLATDIASVFDGVAVYSNVDPSREWTGAKTIEFNVNGFERTPLLSGGAYLDFQIVAACRAKTFEDANDLAESLAEEVEKRIAAYKTGGSLFDGVITSTEITADARGLIEGESFYGLVNALFIEKEEA